MSIGIGIIGAGVMGGDHARTLANAVGGAHLVAISDADAERARAVAQATGAPRTFADGHALIADPAIEGVLIASPDETHAELVLACLRVGKPVLCEKPLAPTTEGCLSIIEAEARLGRRLVQVGFMRRFDPGYTGMKEALAAGRVGAPLMMHCVHRNAKIPPFFTARMLITNSAVHEMDIARWLLDQEIAAATVFVPASPTAGTVDDRQLLVLETERGVIVDVEVFLNAGYGYDVRAEILCESGSLMRTPRDPVTIRGDAQESSGFAYDWRAHFEAAYRLQLQSWVRSIASGQPVGASAWDGYAATATAAACVTALESQQRTRVTLEVRPSLYAEAAA